MQQDNILTCRRGIIRQRCAVLILIHSSDVKFLFSLQYFRVTRDDWARLSPAPRQPVRAELNNLSEEPGLHEAELTNQREHDAGADLTLDGDLHLAPEFVLRLQR